MALDISKTGFNLSIIGFGTILYFFFINPLIKQPGFIDLLLFGSVAIIFYFWDGIMAVLGASQSVEKEAKILPKAEIKKKVICELANITNNYLRDHVLTVFIFGLNRSGLVRITGPFENGWVPINPSETANVCVKGGVMTIGEIANFEKNINLQNFAQNFSMTKKAEVYKEYIEPLNQPTGGMA